MPAEHATRTRIAVDRGRAKAALEFKRAAGKGKARAAAARRLAVIYRVEARHPYRTLHYNPASPDASAPTPDELRLNVSGDPERVARYLSAVPRYLARVEAVTTKAVRIYGRWARSAAGEEALEYTDADGARAYARRFRADAFAAVADSLGISALPRYVDPAAPMWNQAARIAWDVVKAEGPVSLYAMHDEAEAEELLAAADHTPDPAAEAYERELAELRAAERHRSARLFAALDGEELPADEAPVEEAAAEDIVKDQEDEELPARWLEGDIASRPGYQAHWGPEDETRPLVPTLAALCRAGYITTGSQPGLTGLGANGGWWEQHAWADLVVTDRALLDRLVATVTDGGMLVRVHDHHRGAPAASTEPPVVATTCDAEPRMEVGARTRAIDMPRLWPGLHRDLYEEITHGWYVSVVALTAGSAGDRLLWDLLDEVSSGREPDEPDWWTYEPEPGECRLCGAPIHHPGPTAAPPARSPTRTTRPPSPERPSANALHLPPRPAPALTGRPASSSPALPEPRAGEDSAEPPDPATTPVSSGSGRRHRRGERSGRRSRGRRTGRPLRRATPCATRAGRPRASPTRASSRHAVARTGDSARPARPHRAGRVKSGAGITDATDSLQPCHL